MIHFKDWIIFLLILNVVFIAVWLCSLYKICCIVDLRYQKGGGFKQKPNSMEVTVHRGSPSWQRFLMSAPLQLQHHFRLCVHHGLLTVFSLFTNPELFFQSPLYLNPLLFLSPCFLCKPLRLSFLLGLTLITLALTLPLLLYLPVS